MLTVNGSKMSKSLGNSFLPMELVTGDHPLLDKGYTPMTVRFFFLQANYRSTVDFSNDALQAAEKGLKRLMTAIESLSKVKISSSSSINIDTLIQNCSKSMDDDFNTPVTIAHLFDGVKIINLLIEGKETISEEDLVKLKTHFHTFVFDVLGLKNEEANANSDLTDNIMEVVLNLRKNAKENKDYATADFIRDELNKINITIKDSSDGSTWNYEK
jgi:cysteinyl-tRNA synthetase